MSQMYKIALFSTLTIPTVFQALIHYTLQFCAAAGQGQQMKRIVAGKRLRVCNIVSLYVLNLYFGMCSRFALRTSLQHPGAGVHDVFLARQQ